ncbi:uncharacterized protein LOC134347343 [Mobula hypostoma]|uniref:uncharacterized protein LOC134347343 n=1 Tax=Mobula hypostoma TaxID=723540 RepID=UPI002FC3A993
MAVLELQSEGEFTAKLQEAGDKLVVVDFFATWCQPCKMIKPTFAEFSEKYTDMIFCSIDVDEVEDVAQSKDITPLPTFIVFKCGKEVKRIIGSSVTALESTIKEAREM